MMMMMMGFTGSIKGNQFDQIEDKVVSFKTCKDNCFH